MLCWANIFQVTFFNYTERQVPPAAHPQHSVTTQVHTRTHTHTDMHSHECADPFTLHRHTRIDIPCLEVEHLFFSTDPQEGKNARYGKPLRKKMHTYTDR